jgi:hypothetical protein
MNNIFMDLSIFTSPLPNRALFFSEFDMQTYGKLYSFWTTVTEWAFSILPYDKYLHLMQKSKTALFLLLSNVEYVVFVELHHGTFHHDHG